MSDRFLGFARARGFEGHLVRADSLDEGQHWFAVVSPLEAGPADRATATAVDWTARQFHNAGYPAPATDPDLIPCPLVFDWPGTYPLEVVTFETTATVDIP